MSLSCDLFCRVVDNFGDAAVCWRLAKQLVGEHGWQVRLWIDDIVPLSMLRPGFDPRQPSQTIDGVEVLRWPTPFPDVPPRQVAIEAFACELPERFVNAMAAQPKQPVWLNLEYLSAEPWVVGCHGLPSPHPRLPLIKHFFFPGFVAGTGGLIRERDLVAPVLQPDDTALRISLFCYENTALPRLLDVWRDGERPIVCRVADGAPRRQTEEWLGQTLAIGRAVSRGKLQLEALPFLPQTDYDVLLRDCQVNFVRGEDSFVRAQWAERPFVWQAYPQEANAHIGKLTAFLNLYTAHLSSAAGEAVAAFGLAWNGQGDAGDTWHAFAAHLNDLQGHGSWWAKEIGHQGNLAENLVSFCRDRI